MIVSNDTTFTAAINCKPPVFYWRVRGRQFSEMPSIRFLYPLFFPPFGAGGFPDVIFGNEPRPRSSEHVRTAALNSRREENGFVFIRFRILRLGGPTLEIPTLAYFTLKFEADFDTI